LKERGLNQWLEGVFNGIEEGRAAGTRKTLVDVIFEEGVLLPVRDDPTDPLTGNLTPSSRVCRGRR